MTRIVSLLLGCFLLSVAHAQLGTGFSVRIHDAGLLEYTWDRTGETGATRYTIRRNGIITRRTTGSAVNPFDGPIYFGESYQATLQVDDGPESQPIPVAMSQQPAANPGGELLWIVLSFADREHPIYDGLFDTVFSMAQWVTQTSGGRTVLTPTIRLFTLSGTLQSYCAIGQMDMERIKAEIVAAMDLRNRPNLHRVALDGEGHYPTCTSTTGYPMNSGTPMWPGGPIAPQVNRANFVHEYLHTLGLWHFGYLPSLPANVDDLTGLHIGAYGGEIMGGGTDGLSTLNRLVLGWRDAGQVQRVTGTTTLTLTQNHLPGGIQAALIPLSPAGAAYVIDYRDTVRVNFRPTIYAVDRTAMQLGTSFGSGGRILTDSARGIAVDVLSFNASSASVRITVPNPNPPSSSVVVRITAPVSGSTVPAKSSVALAAVTEPAGRPITWTASGGSISGSTWTAPGAKGKTFTLTASSGTAKASVTVRTK